VRQQGGDGALLCVLEPQLVLRVAAPCIHLTGGGEG